MRYNNFDKIKNGFGLRTLLTSCMIKPPLLIFDLANSNVDITNSNIIRKTTKVKLYVIMLGHV
jgi:hypothetical protein